MTPRIQARVTGLDVEVRAGSRLTVAVDVVGVVAAKPNVASRLHIHAAVQAQET